MSYVKESVKSLSEYYVLQDFSVVKLNQNESPYDVPEQLKKEILERLAKTEWNRYCENRPSGLINAISDFIKFPTEGIVAGNASNEIIQAVFAGLCRQGDNIVVITPGFSVYPRLAQIYEIDVTSVPLLNYFEFDVPGIIEAAKDAKMVILPSPNNPTGTSISIDDVIQITENINGIFVLDEAYIEFHQKTAQEYVHKYENLVIIRTFSKAFSLAGLRLGYLLAQPHIAKELEKAKLPFSVGIFQQIAGEVLMRNYPIIKENVDVIIEEREKLFEQVSNLSNVQPIPSSANFFIFSLDGFDAEHTYEYFYKNGILLRHFGDERLKDYVRVTVGKPEENEKFLTVLKNLVL
ncbi:histidinol-phosphate transaminase [candidate division KSB1 bacterium]|nr:histidinol-phosphate transaminase [candidate division KSB1 bacterium]MBL7095058.1 histidinol-phosphate transaminase [candidate division KSB1 bacterium]